jgi:hypothetical protein
MHMLVGYIADIIRKDSGRCRRRIQMIGGLRLDAKVKNSRQQTRQQDMTRHEL